ncbi:MAG: UDP-N-acetylmuramoyl-L-alanyl-D-glutamate--2,6-diaminopimelate ligase [Planctomycetales bacterium]|nr:UDP-N-acetylmuramoyl-L-alanyl-D-glutamate--2,6-diaminopimelate ligase [Planctomycetales bacterium]
MVSTGSAFPVAVSLRRLFPQARFVGCANICATDAFENSVDVCPNSLFAVVSGMRLDGTQFIEDAVARGASGLLVNKPCIGVTIPQCIVPDVRAAFSRVCEALAGDPTRWIDVAGVTGTNGKTTTTWLVRSLLQRAGRVCGVLGTVEYSDGLVTESARLTTPESRTLAKWLQRMPTRGTTHAAIELSSHALHQGRAAGIELEAAVITNITQDHFDYHGDYESYHKAKARILEIVRPGGLIALNVDDPGSWLLRSHVHDAVNFASFGQCATADVAAQVREESLEGTRFRLSIHGRTLDCSTRLVGRHNVSNCLAAAATAFHFGLSPEEIVDGIEQFNFVPGRMERIKCDQPFEVFVDYAHTDDALRRAIQSLKSITPGRVLCVFGAGGDRDRTKRPLLGRAAMLADLVVVTSDNPRSEDPQTIIDEILAGMSADDVTPIIEPDRAAAIQTVLELAERGDSVLIAGKGHESEQIVGPRRVAFDDRQVARYILSERWHQLSNHHPRRASA